jgi:hypothetical protein
MANATVVNACTYTGTAPTFSGANIVSGTISANAVSGTSALLSATQTFSGAKTFSQSVVVSNPIFNNAFAPNVFEITESMPERGSAYKRVVLYCANTSGDTLISFPTTFLHTPVVRVTNGLSTSIVTSLTTSGCTVTGAGNTGYLIIEGF